MVELRVSPKTCATTPILGSNSNGEGHDLKTGREGVSTVGDRRPRNEPPPGPTRRRRGRSRVGPVRRKRRSVVDSGFTYSATPKTVQPELVVCHFDHTWLASFVKDDLCRLHRDRLTHRWGGETFLTSQASAGIHTHRTPSPHLHLSPSRSSPLVYIRETLDVDESLRPFICC